MKTKLRTSSFYWGLLKLNLLPLILLTLVITTFSAIRFASSMHMEAKNGLVNLCRTVNILFDSVYEGDYHIISEGDEVYLMKGTHRLNGDITILDHIKEQTGVDITIFYQDTRVLTTVQTDGDVRAIGTRANGRVVEDVIEGGHPQFYSRMLVEGVRYFSYYEPLYAADGTCIGMIFCGKPSKEVEGLVFISLVPSVVFGILTMLVECFITLRFSNRLVVAIQKTESFLETIANGDLHTELDRDVLARKDELGDIDHFKNVNDTYGHECGDVALAEISSRIKEHMQGKGFVARWGGEELLLVYNNMQLGTAVSYMKELLEEIRTQRIRYGDTVLNITMTFGITEGNAGKVEHIVRDADAKLYEGKNNGRNRIVYEMA